VRVEIEEGFLTARTPFGMAGPWSALIDARGQTFSLSFINVGSQWMWRGSCRMLGLWRN
jgi:hypothetical protein